MELQNHIYSRPPEGSGAPHNFPCLRQAHTPVKYSIIDPSCLFMAWFSFAAINMNGRVGHFVSLSFTYVHNFWEISL